MRPGRFGFVAASLLVSVALVGVFPPGVIAQTPQVRQAANVATVLAYPSFYHLRPVALAGTISRSDSGELWLSNGSKRLRIVSRESVPDGAVEIAGVVWDLGRMNPDDPRLASYDIRRAFGFDPDAGWPLVGQVTALVASDISAAPSPDASSIRSLVLQPSANLGKQVTIIGQFVGRNLLGDLPDAPGRSKYDFVLRSADAAIWVVNLRPRGNDFELSIDTRIDTGRWVQISGTLQQQTRGLLFIDALNSKIALRQPPPAVEPVLASKAPSPEVVFSLPIDGERDVTPSPSVVRIQFSREIDPATLKDRVRVTYATSGEPAADGPTPPQFTPQYVGADNVLELRFAQRLGRGRTVRVDLLDGILATDGQPLPHWSMTFSTARD